MMMKKFLLLLFPMLFLTTCTEPVVETFGNIAGTVTDSRTHNPLAGVSIKLTPTGNSQVTGSNGTFQFDNLEVQEYTISFSKVGYYSLEEKVSVKPGLSSSIQVNLVVKSSIVGTVKDYKTQQFLSGVTVKLSPGGNSMITGEDGSFHFDDLDTQEYTLAFIKTGYNLKEEKVTVRAGANSTIEVVMNESTVSAPLLSILSPSNISVTSVRLNASLSSTGGSQVQQHGFCYSLNHNPTTDDESYLLGATANVGTFSADINGLTAGTTYYCRAFAQNSTGKTYSDEISFTTLLENNGENGDNNDNNENNNDSGNNGNNSSSIAVPSGLKLYYTFDNSDCKDFTDNEIDGVAMNNPSFIIDTPNGSGMALSINGNKNQLINIPYNLFKGMDRITISLWIKDFSAGSIISGVESINYDSNQYPKLYLYNNNRIGFDTCGDYYGYSGDLFSSYDYSSIQSGGWHHIVVMYDHPDNHMYTGTGSLYVDGSLIDNTRLPWNDPSRITKVQIGGDGNGTFPYTATMKIDNVRLYGRCLTKNEVKQIYESEK
ncbi:MAG: carboxypeptidase-like regulatory domain-containing protein [Bacteroidaceae bacterium]|nr:carboxypeptidase-like regulatory domain-containing protein [Bacteroidaceae bacterium]